MQCAMVEYSFFNKMLSNQKLLLDGCRDGTIWSSLVSGYIYRYIQVKHINTMEVVDWRKSKFGTIIDFQDSPSPADIDGRMQDDQSALRAWCFWAGVQNCRQVVDSTGGRSGLRSVWSGPSGIASKKGGKKVKPEGFSCAC
jgi:hypothetical protein